MTQTNLTTKQKQTHRHREEACGCHGGGEWGREGLEVWDEQTKPDMDKQEWINNKALLDSTGNYIQYPVINHHGKEYLFKKRNICV